MPISLLVAKKPGQIDDVFKLRHDVFVEEAELLEGNTEKRFVDRFDAFPTTKNLIAVVEDKVIGSMRMTMDSEAGIPADEYYDFRQHLPDDAIIMNCGMFCVLEEHRHARISAGLLLLASYFAVSLGATYVVAPINPAIVKLLTRVGFKAVGEIFVEPHTGAKMQPLVMEVATLNDFFLRYIEKNKLKGFFTDYERRIYKSGEYIVKAGNQGTHAFIIVEGQAEVKLAGQDKRIDTCEQGALLGEMALLTDEVRAADVIATTEVQVIAISKENFLNRYLAEPAEALNLLKIIGRRSKNLLKTLSQVS